MILEPGTSVLVVHRRLYEFDRPRYFVGRVDDIEMPLARITGHSYTEDHFSGSIVGKCDSPVTKIISLSSGTLFIYALPTAIALDKVSFDTDKNGRLWFTAGSVRMDLSEVCRARVPS